MSWPCLWNLISNSQCSHGRSQGGKCPFSLHGDWDSEQKFIEKPEIGILNSDWFDSCSGSFLLVWNSHCIRVRFTDIVSCSDTLVVYSCPFLCLQRRVAKVVCGLCYCWSLLRNNTVATNLQRFTLNYGSRRFVAWDQGCQIGHFMANFEKFGHFLTALAMKKRIWPLCKIWPFFGHFFGLLL